MKFFLFISLFFFVFSLISGKELKKSVKGSTSVGGKRSLLSFTVKTSKNRDKCNWNHR